MSGATLISIIVVVAVVGFVLVELRRSRAEVAQRQARRASEDAGLNEPPSLHPVIDPVLCIGSGACVRSCPEGDVLGLISDRGALVHGSQCIGHGRCAHECPVSAIRLVFGTSERGVDIPHVSPHYESNVAGLYIAGELGGMGLVCNAVSQGVAAVDHIAANLGPRPPGEEGADLVIVGAGPAGVAASVAAVQRGLSVRLLDRERTFGGAILHFPRRKIVQTRPIRMPGYGTIRDREIPKEDLLEILEKALDSVSLRPESGREVRRIESIGEGESRFHTVEISTGEVLRARRVIVAIGRRGMPRKLDVPGEELPHVAYNLLEPELFAGRRALVVGGGNSAAEVATMLADHGAAFVTLSYRRAAFGRLTKENRARLDERIASGAIRAAMETSVTEIDQTSAMIEGAAGAERVDADAVFILIGGVVPTDFLARCGVRVETRHGGA